MINERDETITRLVQPNLQPGCIVIKSNHYQVAQWTTWNESEGIFSMTWVPMLWKFPLELTPLSLLISKGLVQGIKNELSFHF